MPPPKPRAEQTQPFSPEAVRVSRSKTPVGRYGTRNTPAVVAPLSAPETLFATLTVSRPLALIGALVAQICFAGRAPESAFRVPGLLLVVLAPKTLPGQSLARYRSLLRGLPPTPAKARQSSLATPPFRGSASFVGYRPHPHKRRELPFASRLCAHNLRSLPPSLRSVGPALAPVGETPPFARASLGLRLLSRTGQSPFKFS